MAQDFPVLIVQTKSPDKKSGLFCYGILDNTSGVCFKASRTLLYRVFPTGIWMSFVSVME